MSLDTASSDNSTISLVRADSQGLGDKLTDATDVVLPSSAPISSAQPHIHPSIVREKPIRGEGSVAVLTPLADLDFARGNARGQAL